MDITFITGNQHKADYLAKWLGHPIAHQKVDLDEIQSLDLREVVGHKARQAYAIVQKPVLVEDVAVVFEAMGKLPGPLIKWFLEELGNEGLCKLADGLPSRKATVSIMYGLFNGKQLHIFKASVPGHIAPEPRGGMGFGWNAVFIPKGTDKTYGQMTDEQIKPFSHRAKAIQKLAGFLNNEALHK